MGSTTAPGPGCGTPQRRRGGLRLAVPVLLALLLGPAATATAQEPGPRPAAPLFLEPGHWTYDAIRRLNVLGLAPAASDHALAPVTVRHALDVFDHAASRAAVGRPEFADLAAGYRALLLAEGDTAGLVAGSDARIGWASVTGEALAGDGYIFGEDWQGAVPVDAAQGPVALVRGHGYLQRWLSWSAEAGWVADEPVVRTATAAVAVGPFDAWVGRRRLQYGIGRGGGVVLGGALNDVPLLAHRTGAVFDGIGIHVRDPFHFPWGLRILGADRIEAVGGRLSRNGRIDGPYVAFGRLIGTPFTPRITLGINRGAIFGGEGMALTAGRLFDVLVGAHGDAEGGFFENQIFSVMARVRPPLGPLPIEAYVEYGMDDTSGAIRRVPARIAGLDLAAVPGFPALAVGLERASYAESCCGNPLWYRNIFYRGSWADEGRPFAHPLGGHGVEWLGHARLDLPWRGVLLRGEVVRRDRGHENLYALERRGPSTGFSGSADLRALNGQLRLEGSVERAARWDSGRFSLTYARALRRGR
jgi:hypothetical protein